MILLAMIPRYNTSVLLLLVISRKDDIKPSNGVCHLQNCSSLPDLLYTVNFNMTGFPVFTVDGTDISVSRPSPVVAALLAFCVCLQAVKVENDSTAARVINRFFMFAKSFEGRKLREIIHN